MVACRGGERPLWKAVSRGLLTSAEAEERLTTLLQDSPVEDVDPARLVARATVLANRLGHPVYDLLYLVAAMDADVSVVTADGRFARALRATPELAAHLLTLDAWAGADTRN